jgi:PAS domain S-box-containing protein
MQNPARPHRAAEPRRVAFAYASLASLWIIGSDFLVGWHDRDNLRERLPEVAKGLAFVALTSVLLYLLARRMRARLTAASDAREAELRQANLQLQRAKALQSVLARAHQAVLTAASEKALCQEISAALVGLAGMRLAWFAWVDETTGKIEPSASAGEALGYLDNLTVSVYPESPYGKGPTGRAVREGRAFVSADLVNDPSMRPWLPMIQKHGLGSSISVPVHTSSKRGALSAYAGAPDFFDPEIATLIQQLADDLSHGLEFIAAQQERARLLDKLAASEANHRALFENDHVVMLLVDPATSRIEDANPAAARFYGWPLPGLIGKSVNEINTASAEVITRSMSEACDSTHAEFRFQHRLANGSVREVEVHSVPVLMSERRLLFSIVLDVTDRVESVARLHLLQTAIKAAPSAIVITDPIGHIQWANPAFTELTGYELAKISGRTPAILRSGKQDRAFYENLWETISRGQVWRGDLQNLRANGSIYWENMVIAPVISPDGTILHYVAIKRDISAQKEMEQQIVRTQRLESIGLLAGGIAHDLNNVLAPILMATDLFKLRFTDPADHARLDIIHKSAQRGAGIVRQVLTFARGVDGERMQLQPRHLIKEVCNLLDETIPRDIEIRRETQDELPCVTGDATQLHQILLNLGVNSRDAMPDGGVITIGATLETVPQPRVTRSGLPVDSGDYVTFFVRDTGTGMSDEVMEHMFEPFYTTKPRGKGTGLGLSTVLGLVRSHGGGLDATSTLGVGTEFRILIPVSLEKPAPLPHTRSHPEIVGEGRCLLIVDDEEPIRAIIGLALEHHGFTHMDASDGQSGLDAFQAAPDQFSAVILDHIMPRLSGREVALSIKALRPDLPVILISGLLSDHDTVTPYPDSAKNYGDVVLQKPFSQDDLMKAIATILPPEKLAESPPLVPGIPPA